MNKLETMITAMNEKMAENITAINMQEVNPFYDTFIIATAKNDRLLQAIRDNIKEKCESENIAIKRIEGKGESPWILMDYGDIVIHLFLDEERKIYNLEKLWADMPRIDISSYLQ